LQRTPRASMLPKRKKKHWPGGDRISSGLAPAGSLLFLLFTFLKIRFLLFAFFTTFVEGLRIAVARTAIEGLRLTG